ncbi:MAG: YCF48-related protein, partial [Acidobacteriota bacterium]
VDAGRSGVVLKTTDGGESWAFTRLAFKQIPTSLFFVDEQTGWMGGESLVNEEDDSGRGEASDLLFTDDGGRTWRSQRRLSVSIVDIFFLDRMNGWISGYRGSIYRTTDGGRSWDAQKSELETPPDVPNLPQFDAGKYIIQGVWFFDAQNGFAAATNLDGEAGRALGTSDGGRAWSQKWIVPDSGVKHVTMMSPSEAWAIVHTNNGYVYRTIDAGRSWLAEPVEFEQTPPLFKLAARGSDVWLAGGGAIFKRVE